MRIALAAGILALGSGAFGQASTPPIAVQPLIEGRVLGDAARKVLDVDVAWPSGLRPRFPRDEGGALLNRMVSEVGADGAARRVDGDPAWASLCERKGCRLRYSVDVSKGIAADQRGERGFEEKQGIILAPLSRWLVRPENREARGRLHLEFNGGRKFELVSGGLDAQVNRIDTDLVVMNGGHVALGEFTHKSIELPGGRVDIAIGRGSGGMNEDDLVKWIREGANDLVGLLGRFPISRLQIIVARGGPYAVGSAVTMGMGGASIFVVVGERTRQADLVRDWVMTHEMLHVALPNLGFRHRWMEEGLSTYFEPLLRVRRGRYEPQRMWAEFVRAMPQGLPKDGDQGLDRTPSWGRRYWGGAMFWLHVDVEIRKRTKGARSLDDVLRAVFEAGGNVASRWDVPRLALVAENATGTTAFLDTYQKWSDQPVTPDLSALWLSLGVMSGPEAETVTFDDKAPLSAMRRSLTGQPPAPALRTSQP